MQNKLHKTFEKLPLNEQNYVIFYQGNKKLRKSWKHLSEDIDAYIRRINTLKGNDSAVKIGIIGPISYHWMVIDLACLKGGFFSVGIPEHLDLIQLETILNHEELDILLIDHTLKGKLSKFENRNTFYFDCNGAEEQDIENIKINKSKPVQINLLEEYGVAYTSGTSLNIKRIRLIFKQSAEKKNIFQKINLFIKYQTSFWSRNDNKLILFMPFSHVQQRTFIKTALSNRINIILSDPVNCIRHIILEKPNIMVSVPVVYEAMANRIKSKVKLFSSRKKEVFNIFNTLGINNSSEWNPIKMAFSAYLLKDIKKIYGGRANYFVVGSAKVSPEVIKTFHQVGVKILEAYGQSETGTIAMNTPKHFRIGSVGKPLMEVKIGDDGEVLVKKNEKFHELNQDILQVDANGFILTGDIGYFDKDGFLFLQGRKDEVIVLENGKKIFPSLLEEKLKEFDRIRNAVVYAPDGKGLNVILSADKKADERQIKRNIRAFNDKLASHEKISAFYLHQKDWDVESGLLTNSMKVKRKAVIDRFEKNTFIPVINLQANSGEA